MIEAMLPMKRCARCGLIRMKHHFQGTACPNGSGTFNPVSSPWAEFQRKQMEKAEEIYDRCPNVHRATGLPVPFEDAMPKTQNRCAKQASVELWTGQEQPGP